MKRCVLLVSFLSYLTPTVVLASPVTYACRLVNVQAPEPDGLRDVDQVVIDDEADLLDLRVARTVGTQNFTNWTYATGGNDTFTIRTLEHGDIVGAGMRGGVPISFALLANGRLLLAYIFVGVRWFELHCQDTGKPSDSGGPGGYPKSTADPPGAGAASRTNFREKENSPG